jgi:hypothetical protein
MPLEMSPQAQDLLRMIPGLFQPNGSTGMRRDQMADTAMAQAAQNVPMTPELGTAEFDALTQHLMRPPQSVLTQDNELRQFGAMPAPQRTPDEIMQEQLMNEMNTAIPNLAAKGYRNVGPTMPEGVPSIGTPEGYMARSPGGAQKRDVNELRMLAGQNANADIAGTAAPNVLNPQEQAMIDALERDRNNRDATMAERQKLVTQNAQKREATRDFQQDPQAAIFAQLTQAVQGQGQEGGTNPMLAAFAPGVFDRLSAASRGDRQQMMLDQEQQRIAQRDRESDRRFDAVQGREETRDAVSERRHQEIMAREDAKNPVTLFGKAREGDEGAIAATGLSEEIQIDDSKRLGKLTPVAVKHLNDRYKATKTTQLNPMMWGSPVNAYSRNENFIAEMKKEGWPPALIQEFLAQTGQAVEKPNYPGPKDRSNAPQKRSILFPGF